MAFCRLTLKFTGRGDYRQLESKERVKERAIRAPFQRTAVAEMYGFVNAIHELLIHIPMVIRAKYAKAVIITNERHATRLEI